MRVLIHAEGSHRLGAGHQIRSALLARVLIKAGHDVHLSARDLAGSSHIWAWHGMDSFVEASDDAPENYLNQICQQHFADAQLDLIIIDQYDFDVDRYQWPCAVLMRDDNPRERKISRSAQVLNSNMMVTASDYPQHASLCGAAWHVLADAFHEQTWQATDYFLLCLGLSDTYEMVDHAIEYILQESDIPLRVVCSEEQAIRLQDRGPRVQYCLNEDARGMATLYAGARYALLSASSVALEAMQVGLPFIALRYVENQSALATALANHGIQVFEADALDAALELAMTYNRAPAPAVFSVDAVQYLERALRVIAGLPAQLRLACWSDTRHVWEWANDASTRAASFSAPSFISWREHCSWFQSYLASPHSFAFVFMHEHKPAVFLRADLREGTAILSINVAPAARGQGLGVNAMQRLVDMLCRIQIADALIAEIQEQNAASLRLFSACGFHELESCEINGHAAKRYRRLVDTSVAVT